MTTDAGFHKEVDHMSNLLHFQRMNGQIEDIKIHIFYIYIKHKK